jgi:hypothetical protein
MPITTETIRIIHKPDLRNPWVVQIMNWRGKWALLGGRATEAGAKKLYRVAVKAQRAAARADHGIEPRKDAA